jgi:arginase
MGAGPLRLVGDPSISDELRAQGWDLQLETIETPDPNDPEIVRIAEGDRRLARRVRAAHEGGAFRLVLAGNCNSCLGTVAGLGPVGVVWFDAHADFDTPDRSLGFFDGMGLAILTGNGWELLRQTIPGFMPVDERDVVLVGVRDLEEHQRAPLDASAMRILPGPSFDSTGFLHALDELRQRASRTYLHIDLDVLDTSEGRANRFAAAGGLSAQQLEWAVEMVFRRSAVAAAALTAYDPGLDEDGRMARAASRVIATVARSALESGPPPPGGPDAPSFRLRR